MKESIVELLSTTLRRLPSFVLAFLSAEHIAGAVGITTVARIPLRPEQLPAS